MFKQKVWPIALGLIGLVTVSTAACASDKAVSNYSYQVDENTELSIDSNVGEITFVQGSSDQITVELTVKQSDEELAFGEGDIDAVKLVAERDGNELYLSAQPDEEVHSTWIITMPKVASVEIDMGVGEINGDIITTDTDIDLGVGDLDLVMLGDDVDRVAIDVGIGDSNIKGAIGEKETSRVLITSQSEARGKGQYRINADVGVGDADITIKATR